LNQPFSAFNVTGKAGHLDESTASYIGNDVMNKWLAMPPVPIKENV
jgi:hypothetical protein